MHFSSYLSYFHPTFLDICAESSGGLGNKICHISRIAKGMDPIFMLVFIFLEQHLEHIMCQKYTLIFNLVMFNYFSRLHNIP